MSNQKQFGVWMDSSHATVVGKNESTDSDFSILATVKAEDRAGNSNEKNSNNREITVVAKYFKEIASHMVNATHIHITGTGQVQEQFIQYLADTPQFKNASTDESTSNKMSDEKLVEMITGKF